MKLNITHIIIIIYDKERETERQKAYVMIGYKEKETEIYISS